MTNSSNQRYFIAWHPEYGYDSILFNDAQEAHDTTELDEGTVIKPVHLVDDAKVREMWEKVYDETWHDLVALLKEILPEPKEGV